MAAVYGNRQLDRSEPADRAVLEICHAVSECLESLAALTDRFDGENQRSGGTAAGDRARRGQPVAAADRGRSGGSVGLAGIAARRRARGDRHRRERGIRAGHGRADLFLPDRLRGALGLEDNDRRYARDNYALNLLAASRRLKLIAGRRGPERSLDSQPATICLPGG